ncbi:hypothetical protein [Ruminococcus flavefaciens]|uniref:Uncharacterized protein n=1 Tax=Ruminococcus flavefaciens TaxID=1265 RepID=A0A1M7LIL6_RUMFL|nr:hypothetical protein [Ruminococcus flavefaciens]SHM77480.1 hypothetical protein SAMN04487860_11373 [Ruminococcus flavefaciens]
MKRAVKAFIAVYFAVFMCFFGGMTAFAWDVDTMEQNIDLKNAPEGTAFADILVKDRKNDKYAVDFNEENGKLLGLTKDCGLAQYSKDGYTSMLLRHSCACFDKAEISEHMYTSFRLKEENSEIFNHFQTIKVAYCDKDGNVLGVTEKAKFDKLRFNIGAYTINANGDSLSCSISTGPPYFMMIVVPFLVIVPAILTAAGIIIARLRKKAQSAKMIKHIQSGEVDNDEK